MVVYTGEVAMVSTTMEQGLPCYRLYLRNCPNKTGKEERI